MLCRKRLLRFYGIHVGIAGAVFVSILFSMLLGLENDALANSPEMDIFPYRNFSDMSFQAYVNQQFPAEVFFYGFAHDCSPGSVSPEELVIRCQLKWAEVFSILSGSEPGKQFLERLAEVAVGELEKDPFNLCPRFLAFIAYIHTGHSARAASLAKELLDGRGDIILLYYDQRHYFRSIYGRKIKTPVYFHLFFQPTAMPSQEEESFQAAMMEKVEEEEISGFWPACKKWFQEFHASSDPPPPSSYVMSDFLLHMIQFPLAFDDGDTNQLMHCLNKFPPKAEHAKNQPDFELLSKIYYSERHPLRFLLFKLFPSFYKSNLFFKASRDAMISAIQDKTGHEAYPDFVKQVGHFSEQHPENLLAGYWLATHYLHSSQPQESMDALLNVLEGRGVSGAGHMDMLTGEEARLIPYIVSIHLHSAWNKGPLEFFKVLLYYSRLYHNTHFAWLALFLLAVFVTAASWFYFSHNELRFLRLGPWSWRFDAVSARHSLPDNIPSQQVRPS